MNVHLTSGCEGLHARTMTPRFTCLFLCAAVATAFGHPHHGQSEPMRQAASAFLASLTPEQREAATGAMDDPARTTWTYLPGKRKGVPLDQMEDKQKALATALLQSALSERGHWQATTVMQLELALRDLGQGAHRDPERYFFVVYGTPVPGEPWGWRVEGHHLSLHFTINESGEVADTPAFLGANPAHVQVGSLAGTRALEKEEDLGQALVHSLTQEQLAQALLSDQAPGDIVTRSKSRIERETPAGIPWGALDPPQQEHLTTLVRCYIDRFAPDLAAADWALIQSGGMEDLHFAWAGSLEPDARHYYRVQGQTFVIEFDKVGRDANHSHCVLRFFDRDFGRDFLKEHYEASPHTSSAP